MKLKKKVRRLDRNVRSLDGELDAFDRMMIGFDKTIENMARQHDQAMEELRAQFARVLDINNNLALEVVDLSRKINQYTWTDDGPLNVQGAPTITEVVGGVPSFQILQCDATDPHDEHHWTHLGEPAWCEGIF